MSLLLPKALDVGLFSGRSWLSSRAGVIEVAAAPDVKSAELLQILDQLFLKLGPKLRPRTAVHLLLSDALGQAIPLPWQEHLHGEAETHEYARACFESRGISVGDDWVLHAGFRHFGVSGIAYALPRSWIELVSARIHAHGGRLRMVMPASAAMYWYGRKAWRRDSRLIIMNEETRLTALLFDSRGLYEIDTQAVIAKRDQAARRLLSRLIAGNAGVGEIILWHCANEELPVAVISESMPNIQIRHSAQNIWSSSWIS